MLDYIIVGGGLAGICFAETCIQNDKSFVLYHDDAFKSTKVAGGLFNPIVLKRFTIVEDAINQLEYLQKFYSVIEDRIGKKIIYNIPVYRKLSSVEEQNDWFIASDKPLLSPFLSIRLIDNKYDSIDAPYNYGEVLSTGFVDTLLLSETYLKYLESLNFLIKSTFNYSKIIFEDSFIVYENIKAKNIVFAEGFGLQHNPFFNYLPLDGTKGELLLIRAKKLKLDAIINASIFILPLENDIYKVGATYNWEDKTENITDEGKNELLEKLHQTINCEFEVIDHQAGIRPTVKDRRPLLGAHHLYKRLHVLNGLGTRGVMLGPTMSKKMFNSIENNIELEKNISIRRFDKKYLK